MEPGFYLISWLNLIIFDSPYVLIFLIALFSIFVKANFIRKYSPYIFISLFYYYSFDFHNSEMGQIRNSLAISILLLSIKYIKQKKFKKFILVVLVATSFHYSAIIFLIAYMVNYINFNKKRLIYLTIFCCGIGIFNLNSYFLNLLYKLPDYTPISIAIYYLEKGIYVTRRGISSTEIWRFLILLFNIIFYDKISYICHNRYKFVFKIYFIGLFIFFALNSNALFSRRFSRPFIFLEGLVLSFNFYSIRDPKIKGISLQILSVGYFFRLYAFLISKKVWHYYQIIFTKFL